MGPPQRRTAPAARWPARTGDRGPCWISWDHLKTNQLSGIIPQTGRRTRAADDKGADPLSGPFLLSKKWLCHFFEEIAQLSLDFCKIVGEAFVKYHFRGTRPGNDGINFISSPSRAKVPPPCGGCAPQRACGRSSGDGTPYRRAFDKLRSGPAFGSAPELDRSFDQCWSMSVGTLAAVPDDDAHIEHSSHNADDIGIGQGMLKPILALAM